MRRVLVWWVVLGLGAGACASPAPTAQDPRSTPDAAGEAVEAQRATPPELTAAKLGAYLRYQRLRLEVDASLAREVSAVASRLEAGGAEGKRAARHAMRVLEAKAEAEERAREQTGLAREEVHHFGELVAAVLQPRVLARTLSLDDSIRTLEEQGARLQGDKGAELEAQLVPLRAQAEALRKMAAERQRYGDATVDLVLTREADLLQNHDAQLARLAGPSR
ncbi:MAG: hypothetical protein L0Y66_18165 [Myxococcaceae bacterium]|nr:hypothetical protein [Myxococcaceae bacterium]MCI0673955.1 hypothetical protein [Myxococcaceae bacterium]